MNKKLNTKIKKMVIYSVLFAFMFLLFTVLLESYFPSDTTRITVEFITETPSAFQIFYDPKNPDVSFEEESSIPFQTEGLGKLEKAVLDIPLDHLTRFRLDVGDLENETIRIKRIVFGDAGNKLAFNSDEIINEILENAQWHDIGRPYLEDGFLLLNTTGTDPYIFFDSLLIKTSASSIKYSISLALSLIAVFVLYKFVYLRSIYNLANSLYMDRNLIFSLAKNDFKTKYAGSYFGIVWAFVQPIMTILVFWFVFQIGFRSAPVKNVPFVLWFTSGLIPWFFFSDAWNNATNCFVEYSYLVRKVAFKISILPMVKVISALFVHIIFIIFMEIIFILCGFYPSLKMLQLFYFSFATAALVISLSFITASIIVFFKDLSQIITIILQFGMWLTPIMWSIDMIPKRFVWIFKLNPMYYIVMGYRDTMINNTWFFLNIKQTFYFWLTTGALFLAGAVIFKKTKPHFADVL